MNYNNIYNTLMRRARDRTLVKDFEKHHIIPKSLGGSNAANNIVKLTFREHYLAHLLLFKIHKNSKHAVKMACALNRMINRNNTANINVYAKIRKIWIENHPMKSGLTKAKMIKSLKEFHNNRGVRDYLCACGCGNIALRASAVRSENVFIKNHKPAHKCLCGCGETVNERCKWSKNQISFLCGCGCGRSGSVSHYYKRAVNYLKGHNKNNPGIGLKSYLSSLTKEQLSNRTKMSLGQHDPIARAAAIRRGKASFLEATKTDGTVIKFSSIDAVSAVGISYQQIKYLIRRHNGQVGDMKIKFIFKYGIT